MDVRRFGRALRFGALLATVAAVGCATPSPTAQRRKRPRPAAVEAKDDDDKGAATAQAGKFSTSPGAAIGAAAGVVAVATVPGTTATTPVTPLLGGAKAAVVVVLGATPAAPSTPKSASTSTPTLPTIAIKTTTPVAPLAATPPPAKNNAATPASAGAGTTTGATASSASLSPGAIALANASSTSISAAPSSAAPAVVGASGTGTSTAFGAGSSSGAPRSTVIGTFRTIRRIAMFYRLDLRESGARSRAIADALRPFDDRVRACYVARLADRPEMGGALVLAFELTPSAPTMQRIARIGGTLDDDTLVKCVTARLSTIPLTPAAATRGTLSYRFSAQERVVAGHSRGDTASAASGAKPIRRTLADEEHEAVTVRVQDPNERP